jgi:DNA-binding transcriptional regulator YiaG
MPGPPEDPTPDWYLTYRETSPAGEEITYEWVSYQTPEGRWRKEPIVRKVDRFGQSWILNIRQSPYVTYRVAARFIGVSVPTLYNWGGKRFTPVTKNDVQMMKTEDLLRLARSRGFTESDEG